MSFKSLLPHRMFWALRYSHTVAVIVLRCSFPIHMNDFGRGEMPTNTGIPRESVLFFRLMVAVDFTYALLLCFPNNSSFHQFPEHVRSVYTPTLFKSSKSERSSCSQDMFVGQVCRTPVLQRMYGWCLPPTKSAGKACFLKWWLVGSYVLLLLMYRKAQKYFIVYSVETTNQIWCLFLSV